MSHFLPMLMIYILLTATGARAQSSCVKEYLLNESLGIESGETVQIISDTLRRIGLTNNITLVQCDTFTKKVVAWSPPEGSDIKEGEYVIYDPEWVREVVGDDRTQVIFLFAHESAHFINRHFGSRRNLPRKQMETEADKFGGCAVARMEADFDSLLNVLGRIRKTEDAIYPNREEAIAAAREGFTDCGGKIKEELTAEPQEPSGTEIAPSGTEIAPSVTEIQAELTRVGCYKGAVDGKWGKESRTAASAFQQATSQKLSTLEPTKELFAALQSTESRVCEDPKPSERTAPAEAGKTLQDVKSRGTLICGVNTGLWGWSAPNLEGVWVGFDVDYCKAIAAAIFGDPTLVKYVPLSSSERFNALQSGEIDVLIRNTSWRVDRDTEMKLDFPAVNFYDGVGFMVKTDLGVSSALELSGAIVCVQPGTTTELKVADYFRSKAMEVQFLYSDSIEERISAYVNGSCDTISEEKSYLYLIRTELEDPESHVVLPEMISRELLGPVVREGDEQWFNIVKWTANVLVYAEELGVTQGNVDDIGSSADATIARLLGLDQDASLGTSLGLDSQWAYNVISAVGNYGEVFERNLGSSATFSMKRDDNALSGDGGLHVALPVQ